MSESQAVFGKRGLRPTKAAPSPRVAGPEPTAAYLELAAAARDAMAKGGDRDSWSPQPHGDHRADPVVDMRDFIGPNWESYRRLWDRMKGSPHLRMSRSLGATIFNSLWLLSRKQYVWGGALLAAQAASIRTYPEAGLALDFVAAIFLGLFGKSIVLMSGARKIQSIRASGATPDVAAIRIESAGGRDWVTPLCGAALLVGVLIVTLSGLFGGASQLQGGALSAAGLGALLGGDAASSLQGVDEARLLELLQNLQRK